MLYIVESWVMVFPEIEDLVERARESGNEIVECGKCKTVEQAIEQIQHLMGSHDEVHIISNNGAYFAAAVILGVDFTWALDLY